MKLISTIFLAVIAFTAMIFVHGGIQSGGSASGSNPTIQVNGTSEGTPSTINFASGSNMTLTPSGTNPLTITFAASGGGGGGANIEVGGFSALPGTCTHTSTASDLYFLTTGGYNVGVCTATNTFTFYLDGTPIVLPSTISFSWLNQGSSTVSYANGYGSMAPANGNFSARVQNLAVPSFVTNVTLDIVTTMTVFNSNCFPGLEVDDGTHLVTTDFLAPGSGTSISYWSSVTNLSSNLYNQPQAPIGSPHVWHRIVISASTITFFYSVDGQSWAQVYSEAITAHLTAATNYGWYSTCPSGNGGNAQLLNFRQTIN